MADNFNVKNYLRENKLGSYRLLNENYVDLHPIGEAPIKPTNIYNPETNGWMDTVDGEKVGNWTVHYEYPGLLIWNMEGGDFSIYATPKWQGRGTPIEVVSDEAESILSDEITEDEFGSFEEYAKTLLPHINKAYNRLVAIEKSGFSGGEGEIEEAMEKEGNFSLNDLVTTWDDMYGESFKDDYSGFYDELNPNVSLTIPKVAELWKQMYGEDFEEEYPAIVKKLSNLSSMEEASMTAGKDWQYDDNVDSETGIPYTDDDHDRFWDLGGSQIHSAVRDLLDDGFELRDIIDFIKSHYGR